MVERTFHDSFVSLPPFPSNIVYRHSCEGFRGIHQKRGDIPGIRGRGIYLSVWLSVGTTYTWDSFHDPKHKPTPVISADTGYLFQATSPTIAIIAAAPAKPTRAALLRCHSSRSPTTRLLSTTLNPAPLCSVVSTLSAAARRLFWTVRMAALVYGTMRATKRAEAP